MKLTVIVLSYNTAEFTKTCLESVLKNTKHLKYELIVIDNASDDGSISLITKIANAYVNVKLIKNKKNLGFTGGNNQGMKIAKGEYVLLLNSDTVIHDNVLSEMVLWMDKNMQVGISSCRLVNRDGSEQGTGGYFPTLPRVISWMTIQDLPGVDKMIKPFHPIKSKLSGSGETFYDKEKELDWITGAFFLIRGEVIKDIGYLDDNYFMYTEDVDYCYRAKKMGWKIWYTPKWKVTHLGGVSGSPTKTVLREFSGVKRFYKKHYPGWQYPMLRLFLKLGSVLRMITFGLLEGKSSFTTYAKAFKTV